MDETRKCDHSDKATEQYFSMILFVMQEDWRVRKGWSLTNKQI